MNPTVEDKGRVLIVDDETSLLRLLSKMIEGFGYRSLTCEDGSEAVEILKDESFEIVLTDMVMPVMGGMELIVHCRDHYPDTHVIVMTGYGRKYSYTDVIKEGAVDFIEKPVDMDELRAKLERVRREQHMLTDLKNEIGIRKKAEEELRKHQLHLQELVDERTKDLKESNRMLAAKVEQHRQAEEEIRAYAEKIKLFAYSVSHDLKTPAIAINGLANLLEKKYLDGNSRKVAEICRQVSDSSEQLMNLVDNINLYIKAKETPVFIEEVSVEELFESIYQDFAVELEEKEISWEEDADVNIVRADKLALTRAFRNFIDNSLKYGGDGLSTIKLGLITSKGHHIFSVYDNGIGIDEDEAETIFELFSRCKSAANKKGNGMGLAIVKEIAEKHKGHTWVETADDGGTSFFFSIDGNL